MVVAGVVLLIDAVPACESTKVKTRPSSSTGVVGVTTPLVPTPIPSSPKLA